MSGHAGLGTYISGMKPIHILEIVQYKCVTSGRIKLLTIGRIQLVTRKKDQASDYWKNITSGQWKDLASDQLKGLACDQWQKPLETRARIQLVTSGEASVCCCVF